MKQFYFNGKIRKIKDIYMQQYVTLSRKLIACKEHLDRTLPQLYANVQTHYENDNIKYVQNEIGIIKANMHEYAEQCKVCAIFFRTKEPEHFARCFLAYYNSLTNN